MSRLTQLCFGQEYEAALKNAQVSRSTAAVQGASFVAGSSTKADGVSGGTVCICAQFHPSAQARLLSMKRFLLADLEARVRRDWPASVAGVSYDNRGFLVAEYNLLAASAEGDVLGYMNRLQRAG